MNRRMASNSASPVCVRVTKTNEGLVTFARSSAFWVKVTHRRSNPIKIAMTSGSACTKEID